MAYSAIIKPSDYFNTLLYNGNDTADTTITGVGFQSDFTWIKSRLDTENHNLFDAVRGGGNRIYSNLDAVNSYIATTLTSWNSDGFVVGTDDGVNKTNGKFASWNWKANGLGSANSDGTITSTYTSANATSKCSIVKWTGTGSNATVGHGLGVIPKIILMKKLSGSAGWVVYHNSIGAGNYLRLNTTATSSGDANIFNNTTPTSSVFSLGTDADNNGSGSTYVAYCFADVPGFSKISSYTGNGSANGAFVYTGFKPAFVLIKNTAASEAWFLYDNKRGYNGSMTALFPDETAADASANNIDLLSNGFKLRTGGAILNANGTKYIYMAFAGEPLVSTNGNAATAR